MKRRIIIFVVLVALVFVSYQIWIKPVVDALIEDAQDVPGE